MHVANTLRVRLSVIVFKFFPVHNFYASTLNGSGNITGVCRKMRMLLDKMSSYSCNYFAILCVRISFFSSEKV